MPIRRSLLLLPLLFSLAGVTSTPALAQVDNFPSRPIRFINPFQAGATTDVLARIVSEKMSANWGQPVVVDNKPGAGGLLAAELTAKAPPDGHTIVAVISSHVVQKNLVKNVPFDALKDFEPVVMLARTPLVLLTMNSMPVKTVPEFVTYARQQGQAGKTLTYGSSGIGAAVHLTTELFKQVAQVPMEHVPYKGGAPAMADLLGGHVPVVMSGLYTASQAIQAGKVKPLAVTTAKRLARYPNIPTMQETYPGFVEDEWWVVLAPAGTPKAIVNKLNAEFTRIFSLPEVKEKIAALDIEYIGGTPADAAAFMQSKSAKWDKVLQQAGIKPE
jgi:tripartite-type tricarboxylate transporter receptor subunit TctC